MPYQPRLADPARPEDAASLMAGRMTYVRHALLDPPEAPPGKKKIYGGGTMIAACMAERATKRHYEELIQDLVFKPLGMTTVQFGPMGSSPERESDIWQHHKVDGKVTPDASKDGEWEIRAPAGRNVRCSVIDLARFSAEHLRGARGNGKLLKKGTFKHLHKVVLEGTTPGFAKQNTPWALGPVLWHSGSNMRNYALMHIAPTDKIATCVMTNLNSDEAQGALNELNLFLVERGRELR